MPDIQALADERARSLEHKRQSLQDFGHDALMKGLYYIWDAFDRCGMQFFLIGDTGRAALEQGLLHGIQVDVGIRDVEWVSGGRRIFDTYMGKANKEDEKSATYICEGIPVVIHVFADNPYLKDMNHIMYQHEMFNLPNPLDKFEEEYNKPDPPVAKPEVKPAQPTQPVFSKN